MDHHSLHIDCCFYTNLSPDEGLAATDLSIKLITFIIYTSASSFQWCLHLRESATGKYSTEMIEITQKCHKTGWSPRAVMQNPPDETFGTIALKLHSGSRPALCSGCGYQLPPTQRKRPADSAEQDCQDGRQRRRTAPLHWPSHFRWTDRVGQLP